LPLHALLEALGYGVGFQVYRHLKKKRGDFLPKEWRFQLMLAAILGALIGSKIPGLCDFFVATNSERTWLSSKTVVGGLLGGFIAVEMVKAIRGIRQATGDLWTQPVILGMILGRIGCFLAGPADGTWGRETSSFLGITVGVKSGSALTYHPAPLYEIAFLLLCSWMVFNLANKRPRWNRYRIFLFAYLAFRLVIDTLKSDPILALSMTSIQWACVLGMMGLLLNFKRFSDSHQTPKTEKP
jgi:phosphatidylglycerol---prolipoprotein diacylglyceryl transferase